MATKKPRRRSQILQTKNRDEPLEISSNQSVETGVGVFTTDGSQQLYVMAGSFVASKGKGYVRILEKDLEISKKSTSKSFSLKDLEQDPAYKYGVCITKLKDLFKTDQDVEEWLNSHESGLPQTPLQYLEEGKFEVVERLIGMIEHGIPS